MNQNQHNGLVVVNKPKGITSRLAVDRALHWFGDGAKIGHAGTLDPLATGVLVLCIGKAVRLVEYVQDMDKDYRARIRLDGRSTTDDATGEIEHLCPPEIPPLARVANALNAFVGQISQVPPDYSAARVGGSRAHRLARSGHQVELAPRIVSIYAITLLAYAYPVLDLDIRCGKGTYIRSLARDLGAALGCGGYIEELCRTRIGPFKVADALDLESSRDIAQAALLPLQAALATLPIVQANATESIALRQGKAIPTQHQGEVAILDASGDLLAVGTASGGRLQPRKVFANPSS